MVVLEFEGELVDGELKKLKIDKEKFIDVLTSLGFPTEYDDELGRIVILFRGLRGFWRAI